MDLLPSENLTPEESNRLLKETTLEKIIKEGVYVNLEIKIPKFDLKSETGLNQIFSLANLEKLNGSIQFNMFDPAMDGMIKFRQATAFGIDEEGVKAAAVTSGEIDTAIGVIPGRSYSVKVDRTFYFSCVTKVAEPS